MQKRKRSRALQGETSLSPLLAQLVSLGRSFCCFLFFSSSSLFSSQFLAFHTLHRHKRFVSIFFFFSFFTFFMASAVKHSQATSSKPLKNPNLPQADTLNPISSSAAAVATSTPTDNNTNNPLAHSLEDQILSRASHLTRPEVLRRRSRHLKRLAKCYRDHYWALMEDLKVQYREYCWKYGVSPFKEENRRLEIEGSERADAPNCEGIGENGGNGVSTRTELDVKSNNLRCAFVGCKLKAMALTSFCHLHILSDSKQKLYKACSYVVKSSAAGPITCGKPILRSTVPSFCTGHFQKAQRLVMTALKKAGLNVSSSSKLAPKFHVIVAEYVRQIQAKRRAALRSNTTELVVKEETMS